jgi:hypothetical protein
MRVTAIKIIFAGFAFWTCIAQAIDLSSYEQTCQEIGFKRKTPAFGECVLDLAERAGQTSSAPMSTDDQTCQKYGFKPKTQAFAECKFKLDMAKQEGAQAQEKYAREKAEYDRQVAAMQREQEKARAMKQLELGLRMMGGQSPVNAINSVGTGAPIAPSMPSPINQTITTPSGRMINCTTIGNNTNCF